MHSALSPDALGEAIRIAIDPEHRALFSSSGYDGNRPILGEVSANTFRLQKRRISRNDFAGHFYGTMEAEPGGARIEGYFAAPRWARYFMRFWIAFALICGVPVFVSSLRGLFRSDPSQQGDLWVGTCCASSSDLRRNRSTDANSTVRQGRPPHDYRIRAAGGRGQGR